VSPYVVDPDDPSKVTVWGDLAEVDNRAQPDREGLWAYWAELVRESVDLGFAASAATPPTRCPPSLWRFLIEEARAVDPDTVVFFAETLGAPVDDVLALKRGGVRLLLQLEQVVGLP
jgi:starch synthase (maltosyl-transferring)